MSKKIYNEGEYIKELIYIREDLPYINKKDNTKVRKAFVKCYCGNIFSTRIAGILNNRVKSCGCSRKEKNIKRFSTHNMSNSPEYMTWTCMKNRCSCKTNTSYSHYGGRGIIVCDEWINSFENFIRDMGNKPSKEYSIERIDVDKGYYKENCKWVTSYKQDRNKTNSVYIEFNGERKVLQDWADEFKMHQQTLRYRMNKGLSIEEAINLPYKIFNK